MDHAPPISASPATWRLGIIGFGYNDWVGTVYPSGVDPQRRLAIYATRFDTVEIDATFHAMPRADVVRRWGQVVPEAFRFSLKTPQVVTHEGSLTFQKNRDAMRQFLDAARELGPKLGVVLLQFPSRFRNQGRQRIELELFLRSLPSDIAYAVELRHSAWWTRDTAEMFRLLNGRGGMRLAWVGADQPTVTVAGVSPEDEARGGKAHRPKPLVVVGDWLYLRWVGAPAQFPIHDREVIDPTPRLRWWAQRLEPFFRAGSPIREVYGYFGNSYAGHAPTTLQRFAKLAGLAVAPAEAAPGLQHSLF